MYFLLIALVVAFLWFFHDKRRQAKRLQLEATLFESIQKIALLTLSGEGRARDMPNPSPAYAPALRRVQVIAESCEIVERSKKRETRESRLAFMDEILDEMLQEDRIALVDAVFDRARVRMAEAASVSACKDVLEPVHKALKAAQRASRDETILKYVYQARDLIDAGIESPKLAEPEKQVIERLRASLAWALQVADDHVEMHLRLSKGLESSSIH
jgi:hypothetical protein